MRGCLALLPDFCKKGRWWLHAPLAQLDRVAGFEPVGREFESLRARHPSSFLASSHKFWLAVRTLGDGPKVMAHVERT